MMKTAYHIEAGATVMYEIDAADALARFPNEWKDSEWTDEDKAAAAKAKADADAAATKKR